MAPSKLLIFILFAFLFFLKSINAQIKIEIADGNSLVQLGAPSSTQPPDDKRMALVFYNALLNNNIDSIKMVENYYLNIYKNENFIDYKYYSSLFWISKCIILDKEALKKELNDPLSENLFQFFTENNYQRLRDYLGFQYRLYNYGSMVNKDSLDFYRDFLPINAPIREEWERTSEILNYLPLKKGDNVIDVGCGFGYFSFKLAQMVGDAGKVYATEIKDSYVNQLKYIISKSNIKNIFPIKTDPAYIGVNDSVDAVFMCGLYHHFYGRTSDKDRSILFNSMKNILKPNGYLIIEENLISNERELTNFYIEKRLIISQLAFWGFSFISYKQFLPHRYVIIFKHTNEKVKEQTLYAGEKPTSASYMLNINSKKSLFKFLWSTVDNMPKILDSATMRTADDERKRIIDNMKIQKGQVVVNFGMGRGAFSNLFSQLAGDSGSVYALEFANGYREANEKIDNKQSINNIEVIKNAPYTFQLEKKADVIFIYSYYYKVYGLFTKSDREKLIKSIIENLNTQGKLVIVDNSPADDDGMLEQETFLNKKLIEYQLSFYGFKLINDLQLNPQHYMLTFELKKV